MRRILIVTANRAETGLLKPIFTELSERKDVEAKWCNTLESDKHQVMTDIGCAILEWHPDIILVPCDREEMVYAAAYAFHNRQIVAHFHAGNLGADHPDEMNRRAISCFSHILLCNTEEDKQNLIKFGEEAWRCHVVGSTAFDHIDFDFSACPSYPYNLVLLHPDPDPEQTKRDLEATIKTAQGERGVVWLAPNHDRNHEIIRDFLLDYRNAKSYFPDAWQLHLEIQNLQREVFLGLLKKCKRFIGNSSSMFYEAPFFGVECVAIGKRNIDRKPIQIVAGGSKRIADLLASVTIDEKLRRKRFQI